VLVQFFYAAALSAEGAQCFGSQAKAIVYPLEAISTAAQLLF